MVKRIRDLLVVPEDEPVCIGGNICLPFEPQVDYAEELERIFGKQGPIELDFSRGRNDKSEQETSESLR
jgi:hypothetical protein